jgi:hypothetical protein
MASNRSSSMLESFFQPVSRKSAKFAQDDDGPTAESQ